MYKSRYLKKISKVTIIVEPKEPDVVGNEVIHYPQSLGNLGGLANQQLSGFNQSQHRQNGLASLFGGAAFFK